MCFVEATVLCCILCFLLPNLCFQAVVCTGSSSYTDQTVHPSCGITETLPAWHAPLRLAPEEGLVCPPVCLGAAEDSGLRLEDTALWLRSCQSEKQPLCPVGGGGTWWSRKACTRKTTGGSWLLLQLLAQWTVRNITPLLSLIISDLKM